MGLEYGRIFKSQNELGEAATDIVRVLSQHKVLHNEVEEVFQIVNGYLGHSPISFQEVVDSIQGTSDHHNKA